MRPAPAAPATDRTEIDLANLEDRTLIDLSRGGDLDAFNELVARYQNAVYGVALKMVRNPATAEDLAQDTFISAFRNIARFRGGNFRAWLLRIARNATYDHLRRMKRRPETSIEENIVAFAETFESSDPEPEAQALTSELGRAITEGAGDAVGRPPSVNSPRRYARLQVRRGSRGDGGLSGDGQVAIEPRARANEGLSQDKTGTVTGRMASVGKERNVK